MLKSTRPGMTLREFGCTNSCPTVPTPYGACARAASCTACTMCRAPSNASRRLGIGVVPACDSMPCTVQSNQRCPCKPLDHPNHTPLGLQDGSLLNMGFKVGV